MKHIKKEEQNLIPYSVITAAKLGDTNAMKEILKHYENYISHLSTKRFKDDYGNIHYKVDSEIKGALISKLL